MRAGTGWVLLWAAGALAGCGGHTTQQPPAASGDDAGTTGDDAGCGSCAPEAGPGPDSAADAAPPPATGDIGPDGGTASRLLFAIVGDTRPPYPDDTSSYPLPIITKIYDQIEAASPRPLFGVSTGDYQFSSPTGDQASAQLDMYLGARQHYSGLVFPTMGNHECTGATDSNCGTGNPDGITNTYTAYMTKLLAPLGKTQPWYEVDVAATDGSWTAKFLFVAANAWTQDQATWFAQAMARATTYTFVVRHEPRTSSTAPGVTPSELVMYDHPYTLSFVGHTHTYDHQDGLREVLVGNGGAPPSGGKGYGYGLVSQRADGSGTLDVDMIDSHSGQPVPSFHFAVKPDGSPAQ